jgi:hypothetical protein
MAQAYEYVVTAGTSANTAAFEAAVGATDADGWEVIGFSVDGGNLWALFRRRLCDE